MLDSPDEVKRRSGAARELARSTFSAERAMAPLLDWVQHGKRHGHSPTDLLDLAHLAADAAAAQERAQAATVAQGRAEAEVELKRHEVAGLNKQIQALTSTVDRLSRAIDEVAGFKREAIQILGNQGAADRLSRDEAVAENALLRADIEKKSAEILAMDQLRERLENDLENLRREVRQLQQRGRFRR